MQYPLWGISRQGLHRGDCFWHLWPRRRRGNGWAMNESTAIPWSYEIVFQYALMGACVGVAYYMAQRLNLRLQLTRDQRWLLWVMEAVRIVAAIAFFGWLASIGAVPVLAAFVGFLVGRLLAGRIVPGPD